MGLVHPGVPKALVEKLKEASGISTFVETGTYLGATSRWAASLFEHVISVEKDARLYERVAPRLKELGVRAILGSSPTELAALIPFLDRPAFFWLDAHWSGGITAGSDLECPLLLEIKEIRRSSHRNIILIDDARLFFAPPSAPYNVESWPRINLLFQEINEGFSEYFTTIVDDVILVAPPDYRSVIIDYCQNYLTPPWAPLPRLFKLGRWPLALISHLKGMQFK